MFSVAKRSKTTEGSPISTPLQGLIRTPRILNELIPQFAAILYKKARKRIYFITIKDNSKNNTKWKSIGKINDWIRKYSPLYYVVRGTQGGSHFHLLAVIEDIKKVRYQKGIHFDVKSLTKEQVGIDFRELAEGKAKSEHYIEQNYIKITIELSSEKEKHISTICEMIKRYFRLKKEKANRLKNKSKKQCEIDRIISYMMKNLQEPREGNIREYTDWIIREKYPKK